MSEKSPLRRRITPSVPFTLVTEDVEGKFETSFQLAYDLNSMALFEEATGLNMFRDVGRILAERSVTIVTALFWAGVQINHAADYAGSAGLALIRQNVTLVQMNTIMGACLKAFMTQLPKDTQERLRKEQEEMAKGAAPEVAPLAQGAEAPTTAS